jgi:hypothetical protein
MATSRVQWGRSQWAVSPAADLLFTLTPLLFFLLSLLAFPKGPGPLPLACLTLVSEVFFGNTTHICLTFLLLLGNRAFRAAQPDGVAPDLRVAGALSLWCVALYFGAMVVTAKLALLLVIALLVPASVHHNLAQCRGFFAIYAHKLRQASLQAPPAQDRLLLSVFIWFTVPALTVTLFFTPSSVFARYYVLSPGQRDLLAAPLFALCLLMFLRLLSRPQVSGPQLLYLFRLSFWPVAIVYQPFFLLLGLGAAHGLEYIALSSRLTGLLPPRRYAALLLFLLPGVFMVLAQPRYGTDRVFERLWGGHPAWGWFVLPLTCVWMATQVAHFYLDGRLFRLRFPAVRAAVLPPLDG